MSSNPTTTNIDAQRQRDYLEEEEERMKERERSTRLGGVTSVVPNLASRLGEDITASNLLYSPSSMMQQQQQQQQQQQEDQHHRHSSAEFRHAMTKTLPELPIHSVSARDVGSGGTVPSGPWKLQGGEYHSFTKWSRATKQGHRGTNKFSSGDTRPSKFDFEDFRRRRSRTWQPS